MRLIRNLHVSALTMLLAGPAFTQIVQQPVPAPAPTRRDSAALAVLAKAMAAMGVASGSAPIAAAQTTGTLAPATGSDYPSGTFSWTVEVTSTGYEFLNQVQSNGTLSIFASGHGSPKMSLDGQVRPFFAHMEFASPPVHLPFMIFATAISSPGYTVISAPALLIGGASVLHVHISNDADGITQSLSAQEWYFDPSGLPLRVDCRVPDPFNALNSLLGTKDFANYKQFSGVLVPTTITSSLNGRALSIASVNSVQLNPAVADSIFDLTQVGN